MPTYTGTGQPAFGPVTSSGAGALTLSGSGSPKLGPVVPNGVGIFMAPGSGTPACGHVVSNGVGYFMPTGVVNLLVMRSPDDPVHIFPFAQNNIKATGAPSVTDDVSGNWAPGSMWVWRNHGIWLCK